MTRPQNYDLLCIVESSCHTFVWIVTFVNSPEYSFGTVSVNVIEFESLLPIFLLAIFCLSFQQPPLILTVSTKTPSPFCQHSPRFNNFIDGRFFRENYFQFVSLLLLINIRTQNISYISPIVFLNYLYEWRKVTLHPEASGKVIIYANCIPFQFTIDVH